MEYKGLELLTGTLETILDEPVINVANEISKFGTPILLYLLPVINVANEISKFGTPIFYCIHSTDWSSF